MITSHRNRTAMLLVLVLSCTSLLPAAEIKGTVAKVDGKDITIKITSDLLPVAGDKLDVYVEIPNIGKAVVGRGAVATVEGETVVAKIDKATGKLVVGQLVAITSPKPRKRPAAKVPILIGRSAKDAKKAIEDAGFVAKLQVGTDAPAKVKPFTVYAQQPTPNSQLGAGQTITITLYGGDVPIAESNTKGTDPADARDRRFPRSSKVKPNQLWLGVTASEFDDTSFLEGVLKDGPAGKAGLRIGDVILSVGEHKVDSVFCARQRRLVDTLQAYRAGETVPVTIRRDGQQKVVQVVLDVMPPDGGNGRFLAAAEAGETWAKEVIGARLLNPGSKQTYLTNDQRDIQSGLKWLREAIDEGSEVAAEELANHYRVGAVVEKNAAKCGDLLQQARRLAGNVNSLVYRRATATLAELYLKGEGVTKSDAKAVSLYRELADAGSKSGAYELAKLYAAGRGVAKDDRQAIRLYHKAALAGHRYAQGTMGDFAYFGKGGVKQNYKTAYGWFKLAAKNENAVAMLFMGEMYRFGRGVTRDYRESVAWYQKAAKAAYAYSTAAMANNFEAGVYEYHGTKMGYSASESRQLAISLYRKAAKYNEAARSSLKRLGVPIDPKLVAGPGDKKIVRAVQDPKFDALANVDIVPGELIVTVHKDAKREDLVATLKSLGHEANIVDEIAESKTYLVTVPADAVHECRLRLGIHPYVEGCGLNTVRQLTRTYDDPALAPDDEHGWNLRRINVFDAWELTTGGAKIAIVDSGIKSDHEEFIGKLTDPFSVYTRASDMQTGLVQVNVKGRLINQYITEHGTHVAGTAAGKAGNAVGTAGVSPDSPIIPVQSLTYYAKSKGIFGQDWALVQGLNQAMNQGAKVINYSVGGPPPPEILNDWRTAKDAKAKADAEAQIMNWVRRRLNDDYVGVLDRAAREGVVIVKSAGNDNLPAMFDYLSYSRRVISVAATNKNDGRAIFGSVNASNYGEYTTVSAPGQEIWNAYANPQIPYGNMQGTSMAAPHVAGLVALMKTIDPKLSRREAADILVATGEDLSTDKPIGPLVNAAAAVKEVKRRRDNNVPRPEPDPSLIVARPNPCIPALPRDGIAILGRPRPWQNPDVRRLIDLWLSIALPVLGDRNPRNGPFFFDRFGRVISIRVVYTILPPADAADRYQIIWTNAGALVSRNFGALDVFVNNMMKSGRFNPAPNPTDDKVADNTNDDDPSAANGRHAVTTNFKGLATSFVWKQNKGANTATVTFTTGGREGALLRGHGLPATVTVTATKQGNNFVVPSSNPLSTAISAASANLSRSVGGKPEKFRVGLTFTPKGKSVTLQTKISVGG